MLELNLGPPCAAEIAHDAVRPLYALCFRSGHGPCKEKGTGPSFTARDCGAGKATCRWSTAICWPMALLSCLACVCLLIFWRPTAPHHPSFLYFSTFLSELVCVGCVQEARLHLHFHCRNASMRESPGADSVGCSPLTPRLPPAFWALSVPPQMVLLHF